MKAAKVIGLLAFILLAGTFLAQPVSAGNDWIKLQILENVLQNADSYDIVWDGPAKGKSLFVSLHKDSPSAISNIDFNSQNFDVITYEKTNINDYSSSSYGYPSNRRYGGYGGYGYTRSSNRFGSSSNDRRYFRDTSERIYIDNTQSNLARFDVERTAILTVGSVLNTNTLAQANVENTHTLAGRDVRITDALADRDVQITSTLTFGEIVRARIAALRDVEALGVLSNRDTEITRLTTQSDVDRTSLLVDGETERSRIFSDRDLGLARTAREQTKILADRDVSTTRLQTNRDTRIADIESFRDLAKTDIITNPHPRYDPRLGYYSWRY